MFKRAARSSTSLAVLGFVWLPAACTSQPSPSGGMHAPDAAESADVEPIGSGGASATPGSGGVNAGSGGAPSAGGATADAATPRGDAGPPRVRVSLPEDISTDCSVDETEKLQAVLDGLEPFSTLSFPPNGCFLAQRTLTLADRENVVIEGNGSILRRTELSPVELRYPRHNTHFRFERVSDLIIRALTIEGTNTGGDHGGSVVDARGDTWPVQCVNPSFGCYCVGLEFEHAFSFLHSSQVRLEDSRADAIWGDGVYVGGGEDIVIMNVEVDRNGRQGMAVVDGARILIEGGRILHSRRGGIDLEPDKPQHRISEVEVRNTEIRSHLLAFPAVGNGEVSNVHIHHNTILSGGTPWVVSRGKAEMPRTGWRIEDNVVMTALSSPQPGIRLEYVKGVEVRRNVVPFTAARTMTAVSVALQSEAVIECNHFLGAALVSASDETSSATEANNSTGEASPGCLTDRSRALGW